MKKKLVILLSTALFLATEAQLSARTWTDAATGRAIEADYVESDASHVVLNKGGRTYKIAIARLSDADKAFIKEQSAKLSQSPAAPAPAADLESQLTGYWVPDTQETLERAKKENREVDFFLQKLMPEMTFQFQHGKMKIHIQGNEAENPFEPFAIKHVDKASKTLTLDFGEGKPDRTATVTGNQLTLSWQGQTIVFNRISKETFVKRHTPPAPKVEDVTEKPIPDTPAEGKAHGVDFKIEKATLLGGILILRQGKEFFADQEFKITTFTGPDKPLDGKRFTVKPDAKSGNPHVSLKYKVEGSKFPKTEDFFKGYTMKLEFGTASDGKIPGKIHLRLPDEAKSFVVGTFEAKLQ